MTTNNPEHQAAPHQDGVPDQTAQPLMAHLLDLRRRLLWSFLAMTVGMGLCYIYVEPIYGFLVRPLANAMGENGSGRLIYTDLTEAFFTYVKVAFFAGIFLTFPVLLAQIWQFIAPGLYKHEKRAFFPFLIATPVLFFLGGALVYYVVLPMAWPFFLSFQSSAAETVLPVQLEARVGPYLDLVMTLVFAFGLCFQLPVLLMLMARAGMIRARDLAARRKYAIVVAFIIGAVLTPPDIISQTCLALPLMGLYELSIFMIRRMEPKENADPA